MNENTFTLPYNVTGEERKRLVRAISAYTGADSRYLGVPSCAFQVDYFTISRDGSVSFDARADSEEIEGLIEALAQQGFTVESGVLACEDESEDEATETDTCADRPLSDDSPQFDRAADTGEHEAAEGVPDEHCPEDSTEDDEDGPAPEGDEDASSEDGESAHGLTACLPMEGLDECALENLRKLVNAKGRLIRKALSADRLDINVGEGELEFPWWDTMPTEGEVQAYLDFITAICGMAREAKRVTAREKEVENEKYAFRCFLIRLGFVGSDYKAQRRILLKNLGGSSAFSTQEKAVAFNRAQKARRDAEKAVADAAPSADAQEDGTAETGTESSD